MMEMRLLHIQLKDIFTKILSVVSFKRRKLLNKSYLFSFNHASITTLHILVLLPDCADFTSSV